jgi:tetratricopeptide (TPR) repeat protein
MSAAALGCGRCGALLAPADAVCMACGEPVPVALRASVLGQRAEQLAQEGAYAQAARAVDGILALPLGSEEAIRWGRKQALWLQRSGRPADLEAAEVALMRALRLNDADDLSHQLWIDLLHRAGRLETARQEYKGRLAADPQDAVAARHLASLRLMEDLKLAAPPTVDLGSARQGLLVRVLYPTPYKMITAASGLLLCLFMLVAEAFGSASVPKLPDGAEALAPIVKLAEDPMSNLAQVLLYGAYLYWGYRERHDA